MADICTVVTTAVLMCAPAPVCTMDNNGKSVCTESRPEPCGENSQPPVYYDCKRSDGTTYRFRSKPQ